MQLVCIEENLKVNVADIIEVLEEGFQRHSIDTLVYDGKAPEICEYTLWYTALRSWDFAPFLRHAELRLRHGQKVIASATFDQSIVAIVTKRASTGEKLNPVIDELLSNFRERVEWKKAGPFTECDCQQPAIVEKQFAHEK
jgi:antitoxin component of MazEF toxin-antitoxin module